MLTSLYSLPSLTAEITPSDTRTRNRVPFGASATVRSTVGAPDAGTAWTTAYPRASVAAGPERGQSRRQVPDGVGLRGDLAGDVAFGGAPGARDLVGARGERRQAAAPVPGRLRNCSR